MEEKAGKLCFLLYKSRKTGKIKEKLSKTGGNDLKICMKCKRAFEDEKKVCDFCGEPLIEIRETDGVKKERIKKYVRDGQDYYSTWIYSYDELVERAEKVLREK